MFFKNEVIYTEILLSVGIAMAAGLLVSRFVKLIKLPAVTGYLIAGILIGPYCLGLLGIEGLGFTTTDAVKSDKILCDVALGFIAFAIGNEFRTKQIKAIGKQVAVIGVAQAVVTTIVVDAVLIGVHYIIPEKFPLSAAITLGAIATATAPAATLMVVRQYKAKGKLTDLLLPIVALDDAVGLVVFAVSFGIAKAFESGTLSLVSVIVEPLCEVVLSLALGVIMGVLFSAAEKYFKSNSKRLTLSITFVILTVAISMLKFNVAGMELGFWSLLVCMMLGTIFCNVCDFSAEIMEKTDKWTAPLFVLFFVLSGAELEFDVFGDITVVIVGITYILVRAFGKYIGAGLSAKAIGCESKIVKYLGITLFPQAGVALGMSVTVASELEGCGVVIRNITLFAVLVYELVGPLLTKIALTKSGDIVPKAVAIQEDDDDK